MDCRCEIAPMYHQHLSGLAQLRLPSPLITDGPGFNVIQNCEIQAENRDRLVAWLRENGVEVMIPYGDRDVHQFPTLGLAHFQLPCTERLYERVVMLPMHTELTDLQVEYIAEVIRRSF